VTAKRLKFLAIRSAHFVALKALDREINSYVKARAKNMELAAYMLIHKALASYKLS